MANSISLVTNFLSLLDTVYKQESVTARMDAMTQEIPFVAANVIKVLKLSAVGLGTYSRSTGYPSGDITATWEAMTLACERGRAFTLDRMDNEETLGLVLGNLVREWMRVYVAPEVDAYRFGAYASKSGVGAVATPVTLTSSTVLPAIDEARRVMDEAEVPADGRLLYISASVGTMLDAAITRILGSGGSMDRRIPALDGMEIIRVPQARFYTAVTLNAGATSNAGGFAKAGGGKDLNFMLLHPSAVIQPTKLNNLKYFAPEINQTSDGHLWQYRLYHDAFVEDNKVAGIYIHNKAS